VTLLFAALGALAPAANAHHSGALFDFNKRVTVEGRIVKVDWQNPHVYLTIESTGPDGKPLQQDVQAASLSMIRALGLTREMVAPGTRVKIDAAARKSSSDHLLWGGSITFEDGAVYLLETIGPNAHIPAVPPATGLVGRWVPPPSSIQLFLQTIQTLPLTEAANAGRAPLGDPRLPASFCEAGQAVASGALVMLMGALPVLHTFEGDDRTLVMRIDADGHLVERVIHLDLKTHPASSESGLGHSIGRWDGGTLVIDTAAFAPSAISSRALHAVERITLTEDRRHAKYELSMEDPDFWTKPAALSTVWDYRPDVEPSVQTCDRENARRYLKDVGLTDAAAGARLSQ
jgi:hypothetical protein